MFRFPPKQAASGDAMLRFLVSDCQPPSLEEEMFFYTVQLSVLRRHICFERPSEVYSLFMVAFMIVKFVMVYSLT